MREIVLGGGSIERRHLRNLRSLGVGPLAVVEPETGRRNALCEDVSVVGLEWEPDLLMIASSNHLHVEQALEAVKEASDPRWESCTTVLSHQWPVW